jgi:tetratricopeptide (TPR) repeat protein
LTAAWRRISAAATRTSAPCWPTWSRSNRHRHDESLEEIRRAIALDPLSPLLYAWSVALHGVAGRCDDALADFARCLELDPAFGLAVHPLAGPRAYPAFQTSLRKMNLEP